MTLERSNDEFDCKEKEWQEIVTPYKARGKWKDIGTGRIRSAKMKNLHMRMLFYRQRQAKELIYFLDCERLESGQEVAEVESMVDCARVAPSISHTEDGEYGSQRLRQEFT